MAEESRMASPGIYNGLYVQALACLTPGVC